MLAGLMLTGIMSLSNHWIGPNAMPIFFVIAIISIILIIKIFLEIVENLGFKLANYGRLGKIILIIAIVVTLAGFTVQIKTQVYTVKSGYLATYDNKIRWDNPFRVTTVTLNSIQNNFNYQSLLFDQPLRINLNAKIKLGLSIEELSKNHCIGNVTNAAKVTELQKMIDIAGQTALLKSIQSINTNGATNEQKLRFIEYFREEITKNLPSYLETSGIDINL